MFFAIQIVAPAMIAAAGRHHQPRLRLLVACRQQVPRLHDRQGRRARTHARQLAAQCLPDPIEPVDVARMALFLAADDSAMCTANNYMVEAGSI
jgi:hypothetical protein